VATEPPFEPVTPVEFPELESLLLVVDDVEVDEFVEVVVLDVLLPLEWFVEQALRTPVVASAVAAVRAVAVLTRRRERSRSAAAARRWSSVMHRGCPADIWQPSEDTVDSL
jgi:hypothetical protein